MVTLRKGKKMNKKKKTIYHSSKNQDILRKGQIIRRLRGLSRNISAMENKYPELLNGMLLEDYSLEVRLEFIKTDLKVLEKEFRKIHGLKER